MTDIDTVIVAYGSVDTIGASVAEASRLGPVYVVDHAGDGAADRARASGAHAVVDAANPGFGAGQNRGVAAGSSPFVLLLNPDAAIELDAVAAGLELLLARPDVAAVQGRIDSAGRPERSAGRELGLLHLGGRLLHLRRLLAAPVVASLARRVPVLHDHVDRVPAGPTEVETLAATAVLVRREAFESVGGFDPRYFLYGEDLDLCRRLRARGWRLVTIADRWATHVGGGTSATTWDRELQWWRGTLQFAARWWSPLRFAAATGLGGLRAVGLTLRQPARGREAWVGLLREPMTTRRRR